MFIDDAKTIIGIKRSYDNKLNKFIFICKENNAEIKDKRTNVGEEMRKIRKILRIIEKLIPKKEMQENQEKI